MPRRVVSLRFNRDPESQRAAGLLVGALAGEPEPEPLRLDPAARPDTCVAHLEAEPCSVCASYAAAGL